MQLKSFNVDFNWYQGIASPELFTSINVDELIDWYVNMGVNNFWTFAVTYNGYAWYDSKIAPKAIGLTYDFMSECVEKGHKKGMSVFAYTNLGDNPYYGTQNPTFCRPDEPLSRIILNDSYLDYFCSLCDESLNTAPLDGIVIDWFRQPQKKRSIWIDEEKKLFKQIMGETFPTTDMDEASLIEYERRCLENAWHKIYKTIKSHGDVKIWTNQPFDKVDDPIWNGHVLMKQADYILNECPDFSLLEWMQSQAGENTLIVQNLCGWSGHNLDKLYSIDREKYGFFGFAAADPDTNLPTEKISPQNYKNIEIVRKFYSEM